jgi:uncharacterized linocin/CFP29 family protein
MGVQTVPVMKVGEGEGGLGVTGRKFLPMHLISQDFRLSWRDIEASEKMGVPIELGPAAAAAAVCARAEDTLIFRGAPEAGYEGLLNAEGRNSVSLGDWDKDNKPFEVIVAATEELVSAGFYGPFAVVLSPALYSKTQRVTRGMGRLQRKLITDAAEGGIFRSSVLKGPEGFVVSLGSQNFDLAVAQDLITAYLGPEDMDHTFRVLESLVLRIKRPGAICTLEAK